jgi:hypothetical protein
MSGCSLSLFSMGAGATYLPLAVLKSSFTRPVILRRPVGAALALVTRPEEAVGGEASFVEVGALVVADHRAGDLMSTSPSSLIFTSTPSCGMPT